MYFVDRHRRRQCVDVPAPLHPRLVVPLVIERGDHRRGERGPLRRKRIRVGLVGLVIVARRHDAKLVAMPGARAVGVAFPEARLVAARVQEVGVAVPSVPVADDGHAPRVRRPDRESGAGPRRRAHQAARTGAGACLDGRGTYRNRKARAPVARSRVPIAWASWARASFVVIEQSSPTVLHGEHKP